MKVKFIYILILCGILGSCTSTKKKGELSKTKLFWHNTTALYNGYFNAREILELTELQMKEGSQDNYTQILPLYDYQISHDVSSYSEDLDKAIEKVVRVTALHGPSYWVDDCYVLMGQAQYMKRDYESAEETLEFFKEEFTADNPYSTFYKKQQKGKKTKAQKKREREIAQRQRMEERKIADDARKDEKKDKEKLRKQEKKAKEKERKKKQKARKKGKRYVPPVKAQETIDAENAAKKVKEKEEEVVDEEEKKKEKNDTKKSFKHEPAYYDGLVWLAKTYIERERFSSAENLLRKVQQTETIKKETRNALSIVYADLNIKKGEYEEAIEFLDQAIATEKKKKRKARFAYIQGQLYEQLDQSSSALAKYEKCKSFNPDFEMEFNAILNEIRLDQKTGVASSEKSIKKLEKMLNDSKYTFYHADIYFAVAQIRDELGELEAAKSAYQASVKNNRDNLPLKVESYYRLADMYYNAEEYASAKYYYDSTTMVMPKTDDRYENSDYLSKNLSQIAKNIEIIEGEEAQLALANLSEKELRKIAIDRIKAQNITAKPDDDLEQGAQTVPRNNFRLNVSSFFAYNPVSLQKGIDDFNRVWGDRTLEDNWRTAGDADFDDDEDADEFDEADVTDDMIKEALKDIPRTKVQQNLASKKIQDAKFELGRLYREKLQNLEKGVETHEDLYNNYSNFYKEQDLLFYLYLSNKDLGRMRKAKKYRKLLEENYPDSEFVKILNDPVYAEKIASNEGSIEDYYNQTFNLFEKGKNQKVINRSSSVEEKFPKEKNFKAKFGLLRAMAIGKEKGKDEYMIALDDVVKKYSSSDEAIRAKEILRFLKGDDAAFDPILYTEGEQSFKKEEEKLHYAMVVIYKIDAFQTDEIKEDINKYIKKNHKLDRLSLSSIGLNRDADSQIILIRKFADEETALDFYKGVEAKKKSFIQENVPYDFLVVTQNNYREIIKKRSIKEYLQFFETNYSTK